MCSSTVELACGFQAQTHGHPKKLKNMKLNATMGFNPYVHQLLIIRLPHSRVLRVIARSLLLTLLIVSFPWLGSIAGGFLNFLNFGHRTDANNGSLARFIPSPVNLDRLPILFHDLANEGLLKLGDRVLFASGVGNNDDQIYSSQILRDNQMDLVSVSDQSQQVSIPDEAFEFVFTDDYHDAADFIDRIVKVDGVAAVQLSDDPRRPFAKPDNYKIVYLRRFCIVENRTISTRSCTFVVAMRKTGPRAADSARGAAAARKLLGFASEEKKAALKKLEDVLLEPPRAASGKSWRYLKRTKFLPDLMGDSLESYPRRVFINVGGSDTAWFATNYPTRNKDFEMYNIETVADGAGAGGSKETAAELGLSEWLKRNVREAEYVVMKADAEAVEELVKSQAIRLVDELFLECKSQLHGDRRGRRAYWECLALYGRLRDEGVAVHQWWG